jgi:ADYC domain
MNTTQKPVRNERSGRGKVPWRAGLVLLCIAAGGACATPDREGGVSGERVEGREHGVNGERGEGSVSGVSGERGESGVRRAGEGEAPGRTVRLAADGPTKPGAPLYVPCQDEKECRYVPDQGTLRSCPTGSCDPGSNNGRGIYIGSKGNYCLKLSSDGYTSCPEAFVSTGGGVALRLRDYLDPTLVQEAPVKAIFGDYGVVDVLAVKVAEDGFQVHYLDPVSQHSAWVGGDELAKLSFEFELKAGLGGYIPYTMVVRDGSATPAALWRYQIIYQRSDVAFPVWRELCDTPSGQNLASFTAGFQVDGLTAEVSDVPGAVTLGCETGAIDTCRDWGYGGVPKDPPPYLGHDENRAIFASCLQAKRAAYLAGYGDPTSYTFDGTEIHVLDHFGLHGDNSTMSNVQPEALWGPGGAICLTKMRHPELANDDLKRLLAPCTPFDWSEQAKLATGLP